MREDKSSPVGRRQLSTLDSLSDAYRGFTSSASFSPSSSNKYKILSTFELEEEEMNDQLLRQQGIGSKGAHIHALNVSPPAFSSAMQSSYEDESESLNKPEGRPTLIDESLDFEDLESTMWRKVRNLNIMIVQICIYSLWVILVHSASNATIFSR